MGAGPLYEFSSERHFEHASLDHSIMSSSPIDYSPDRQLTSLEYGCSSEAHFEVSIPTITVNSPKEVTSTHTQRREAINNDYPTIRKESFSFLKLM